MLRPIIQVFIALLSFSRSLATKFGFLNNEACMTRPSLIDLNPIELNYYPFMVINYVFDDLLQKYVF